MNLRTQKTQQKTVHNQHNMEQGKLGAFEHPNIVMFAERECDLLYEM